jgi:O-antigen/teichoic acid export membrane protein
VKRLVPHLEYRWVHVEGAMLKTLATFGLVTFWVGIAHTLRFQFDAIVVAGFLSLQAVTMFSLGSKLVSYVMMVVQSLAQVFTPMSSEFDAAGNRQQLRRVLLLGNRYSSLVMFPLAALMLVLGKTLLRVWVGAAYLPSYPVLVILIVPMAMYLAQAASTKVLYGMAKHQMMAKVLLAEGVANLILSIVLLKWYGIYGVALGTAIPMAITSLFFFPQHLCRLLNLRLSEFLRDSFLHPIMMALPLAATFWLADRWLSPTAWPGLIGVLSLGGLVYGLELVVYLIIVERPENMTSSEWTGSLLLRLQNRNQ